MFFPLCTPFKLVLGGGGGGGGEIGPLGDDIPLLPHDPPSPPLLYGTLLHTRSELWSCEVPYSGYFSRGVYFVDFAERAQFAIESGCGQWVWSIRVQLAAMRLMPLCFEEGLATF